MFLYTVLILIIVHIIILLLHKFQKNIIVIKYDFIFTFYGKYFKT